MRMRNLSMHRAGNEKPATLSRDGFFYPRRTTYLITYAAGVAGSESVVVPVEPPIAPPLPP